MKYSKILTFIAIGLIINSFWVFGQEGKTAELKTPDLTFIVKKLSNGDFELRSRLSLFEKRKDIPIPNANIDFTLGSAGEFKINGNSTDKNGVAIAYIKKGTNLFKDEMGYVYLKADFSGDKYFEAGSAEVKFMEVTINLKAEMMDTVRTIQVEAFKLDGKGKSVPLSGENLTVSVQRMFSRLPIGDVALDSTGKGYVEMPLDIPGDSAGMLNVVVFMADNESYGNVEQSLPVKWGLPKQTVNLTHRALWTQIAPLWMIVSLTILLIGVWAHYLYVVIQLIIIKLKGQKTIVE